MMDDEQEKKAEQLTREFKCLLRFHDDFEVVISAILSLAGQIILDTFEKKEGIKRTKQIVSSFLESIDEAYKHFEKEDGDYLVRKRHKL